VFVAHGVLLDVSFGVARPRLVTLTSGRALADASRAAYAEGLAAQPGVAPGPGAGAGLARIRILPPVERRDSITVGLRWEITGEVAGLFPVLDADITLAAAGEHTATLTLSGVYRPPCGQPGPALLAAPVLHGVADPAALPPDPSGPGSVLVADVAVRALLRYAAGHLAGSVT
jgi:hypothetical protein